MHRRSAFWSFSLCLLLAACGATGDGSSSGENSATTQAAPKIEGVVLDVDGESDLSGNVPITIVETGEVATSNADGAFAFEEVPEGDVTLTVGPGFVARKVDLDTLNLNDPPARPADDLDDTDGQGNDANDDTERSDRDVRIRRLRRGDHVVIHIRIVGDQIVDIRITRTRDGEDVCREREIEIEMTPTDGNPDPDMEGEVEMEVDCEGCQEFEVEVEDATAGDILEAVVVDPEGNEESLGRRIVEDDGDAEWRLDTCDGDALPFGVTRVTGLERHRVKVRTEDGRNLLCARIPDFPPVEPPNCFFLRGRTRMRMPTDEHAGLILARIRGCLDTGFRQTLLIAGKGFDTGQELEFFIEDPENPTTLVSFGTVLANVDGEAWIDFDTGEGDELPFGVETLRVLVGMQVQVRDDVTGDLLLAGRIPALRRD